MPITSCKFSCLRALGSCKIKRDLWRFGFRQGTLNNQKYNGDNMKHRMMSLLTAVLLCGLFATAVNAQILIGSYQVSDGPNFTADPPTYSCLEACAEVFGGASADYACSTSDASVDNQAYVSTWGTGCSIAAEDTKLGTNYNCGADGCSISAYVEDWCFGSQVNYCYAGSVLPPEPLPAEPVPTVGGVGVLALSLLMMLGAAFGLKGAFRKVR